MASTLLIPGALRFLRLAAAAMAALLAVAAAAHAEDIDIYVANAGNSDRPNVLFILDSSANWSANLPVPACQYRDNGVSMGFGPPSDEQSKKIGLEKCALHNTIDALATAPDGSALYNVGLMLFNESPASNSGGYPRIAFTPVTASNKAALKAKIRAIGINADKGNNAAFAKSMHEAFLYFTGRAPNVGHKGSKFDPAAFSGGAYVSPAAGSCGRNYVIFIANGGPGEVTNNDARSLLAGVGGNTTEIAYPKGYVKNSDQANWADEYARFMSGQDVSSKDGAQTIVTYTVAVTGAPSDGDYPNFMRGMAQYGGGKFFEAKSVDDLTLSLLRIFEELAEVDSAFVSASLPVSVNSRGTYLNQIFMGLFRPDGQASPRWRGNLKQYRFNYDVVTDSLSLVDRNGNSAISGATGFFAPTAESYWSATSNFWVNEPMGTPKSANDVPDGEVVEKGGAAQRMRIDYATSLANRKIYTCLSCTAGTVLGSTSATRFETGNSSVTAALLGVGSSGDRDLLINWVRGVDNAGDEAGPGGSTVIRPSVHGDVLHSRPVIVNYGGPRGVVAYYGANDGMLHAIDGAQTGSSAGQQLWAFVPEEGLPKLKRLRDNLPNIRFSTTPDTLTEPKPRDYFFDGPLSFYQKIASGNTEKVYLYAAMRRGGRALYAFDVSEPTAPRFMWRKTQADISVLGQTWSEAKVARIRGHDGPVLIMGAGYDPAAEDIEPPASPTMGNAVLILDAVNGNLLKSFPTNRPVAADVAILDSDYDGYIDRGYAADLGGRVYRLDLETGSGNDVAYSAADWKLTLFADLGSSASRKIFYPPDVVLTRDYGIVMVGTGDREKPLDNTTNEKFFTLIDPITGKGMPADFTAIAESDLTTGEGFSSPATQRGCFVPLNTAGEKVVNSPTTAGGITYFSTNRPTPPSGNSCTGSLGEAKVYGIPLMCKEPESQVLTGGGLPPSPVTGNVLIDLGNGEQRRVPFIIGGFNSKRSGIEGSKVQVAVPPRRQKLFWFTETER